MLPSRSPVWNRRSRRHLLAAAAALAAAALTPAALALAASALAAAAALAVPVALAASALAAAPLALAAAPLALAAAARAIRLHTNRPDMGGSPRSVPVSRRRSRKHPQRRGERRCVGPRSSKHPCVARRD